MNNLIPEKIVKEMIMNQKIRINIVKQNFLLFFHFYFAHYIKYPTADFQKDILNHLDRDEQDLFVVAFRNSAKSTIVTTAFPVWALLGKLEKHFIVIVCQTKEQSKLHMNSLKQELEANELLKRDLGPFKEESNEWNAGSLKFTNTGAKIMIASLEQSIRGLRNSQSRPDLIILDDIEDMSSVKTRSNRNKTYQWLKGELIPAGDRDTRLVIVGNLLHEDSLLKRLEEEVREEKLTATFMTIPLVNESGVSTWPGKYPTQKEIEDERKKIGNEIAWRREYLLEIIPDDEAVIFKEWITRYDKLPSQEEIVEIRVTIDPAVSLKDTADYTAILTGITTGYGGDMKIYLLPNPSNKRMTVPQLLEWCKEWQDIIIQRFNKYPSFYVESVGTQKGVVQLLTHIGLMAYEVPSHVDKRARLSLAGAHLQNGNILFPQKGCAVLEDQLLNFGVEKYDDLADAFSMMANSIVNNPISFIGIA
jgi:predicted phage terminase large subunit-like protein